MAYFKHLQVALLVLMAAKRAILQVTLTSKPSPLNGLHLCPGSGEITLRCVANGVTDDAFRWFMCQTSSTECSRFVSEPLPLDNPELPVDISVDNPIPGVSITLDSYSLGSGMNNFTTTLTVDLALYRQQEVVAFECAGTTSIKSNRIPLNFTIRAPAPPLPLDLVATYDSLSYDLSRITAVWRQQQPNQCADVFFYEIFLTSNSGNVQNKVVNFTECSGTNCSTELDVASLNHSHMATSYSVSVLSRDRSGYHGEGMRVDFAGDVDNTILYSFNHSFVFGVCELYFNYTSEYDITQLSVRYTPNTSHEETDVLYVEQNQLTRLNPIKPHTSYNFVIALGVVNGSIKVEIEGTMNTTLVPARLPSPNLGLLITGLLILFAMALLCTALVLPVTRKLCIQASLPGVTLTVLKVWFVLGVVLMLLSLLLWIVVGFHTGLQDDRCDLEWQSSRSALIIISHVSTVITFLLVMIQAVVTSVLLYKDDLSSRWKRAKIEEVKPPPEEEIETATSSPVASYDPFYMKQNQVYLPECFDNVRDEAGDESHCNEHGERVEEDGRQRSEELYDLPQGEDENGDLCPELQHKASIPHDIEGEVRGQYGPQAPKSDDISRSRQQQAAKGSEVDDEDHLYDIIPDEAESKRSKLLRKPFKRQSSGSTKKMKIKMASASQKPHRYDELEMTAQWLYGSHRANDSATIVHLDQLPRKNSQIYDQPDANVSRTAVNTDTSSTNATHFYDEPDVKNPTVIVTSKHSFTTAPKMDGAATCTNNAAHFYDEPDVDQPTTSETEHSAATAGKKERNNSLHDYVDFPSTGKPPSQVEDKGSQKISHFYDEPDTETVQSKHATSKIATPSQDMTDVRDESRSRNTDRTVDRSMTRTRVEVNGADDTIKEGAKKGDPHYINQMESDECTKNGHGYVNQQESDECTKNGHGYVNQQGHAGDHFYVNQDENPDKGKEYHYIKSDRMSIQRRVQQCVSKEQEKTDPEWPYRL